MNWRKLFGSISNRRKRRLTEALNKLAILQLADGSDSPDSSNAQVLVVSHDAHLAGAQQLLLNLLADWKIRQPFPVKVICVGTGVLRGQFERLFPTLVLADFRSKSDRDAALVKFIGGPTRAIYSSTVVNGPLLEELRALGVPTITHCHELQASIERWAPGNIMAATLANSDYVLSGCPAVARNLQIRHQVPSERLGVVYDFIHFWNADDEPTAAERASLRNELRISEDDIVVFGCGTTDWRKGPDLFVDAALLACRHNSQLKFFWIGGEKSPAPYLEKISANNLGDRIQFLGNRSMSRRYYYVGDIFALTSREDPCPLVALEAANAKLPVVCFDGAGDIPLALGAECGAVIAFQGSTAFAEALLKLSNDAEWRLRAGKAGYDRVQRNHSTESASIAVENAITKVVKLPWKSLGNLPGSPLVTVIVPSYNHEAFLKTRLASIAGQSLDDLEIIVLDDASTDASRIVLESFVASDVRAKLICNELNSGSTFKQWRKGLAAAQGRYVWIAESDDDADRSFLSRMVAELENDSSVMIAHAQSLMIDLNGKTLGRPDAWLNDLALGRWNSDLAVEGLSEIRDYLSQKNTIPNASAVVFRNFPGIELLVDDGMRLCADWRFWIRLLTRGKYVYINKEINYWRQNSSNARTRVPGVLEWKEGRVILEEVGELLKLTKYERAKVIERFRQRCVAWSGGQIE